MIIVCEKIAALNKNINALKIYMKELDEKENIK